MITAIVFRIKEIYTHTSLTRHTIMERHKCCESWAGGKHTAYN